MKKDNAKAWIHFKLSDTQGNKAEYILSDDIIIHH